MGISLKTDMQMLGLSNPKMFSLFLRIMAACLLSLGALTRGEPRSRRRRVWERAGGGTRQAPRPGAAACTRTSCTGPSRPLPAPPLPPGWSSRCRSWGRGCREKPARVPWAIPPGAEARANLGGTGTQRGAITRGVALGPLRVLATKGGGGRGGRSAQLSKGLLRATEDLQSTSRGLAAPRDVFTALRERETRKCKPSRPPPHTRTTYSR